MKICRFVHKNTIYWGALKNEFIFPIRSFESLSQPDFTLRDDDYFDFETIKPLPPVSPSKIVCVGRNYAEHAFELGNEIPKEPLLFLKAPSSIITEGEPIIIPSKLTSQVEHEGELAVIIGRKCKNLSSEENPSKFIFGYICLNDVTARDLQRRDIQFTRAKSFDTFCPIGAIVETNIDVSDLRITTRVNEDIKQEGRTSQMIFSVPFLIQYISNQMTLNPGDIIATGTPSGVSKLNPGDLCEVEIEGIGNLTNPIQ